MTRLALLLAVWPGIVAPAAARTGEGKAADLCLRAAEEAARETGVPLQVLLALTLTETGRTSGGRLQPWPWALNQGGEGRWFPTQEEALADLAEAVEAGVTNIDIGCFQLNYRWHGAAFDSLEQMMDPRANALYAARLVARHAAGQGDWIAAAGAYHSATPEKAALYLARFEPIYAALGPTEAGPAAMTDLSEAPPDEPRVNRFPLLMAGATVSSGSLVPLMASGRALIGGP